MTASGARPRAPDPLDGEHVNVIRNIQAGLLLGTCYAGVAVASAVLLLCVGGMWLVGAPLRSIRP